MAGFQTHNDDDPISDINVTPFVDIVLVLLIIFMVTTSAIVKAAITVDLPKASTAQTLSKPPISIILSCTEKQSERPTAGCTPGKVLVDGVEIVDLAAPGVSVDPLVGSLRSKAEEVRAATNEAPNVLITADKDLRFQNVIWLMDICKNLGYGAILFNSELFTQASERPSLPQ